MPYKSEKIKIVKTGYDRRVKLTPEQKEEIRRLYFQHGEKVLSGVAGESYSQRALAKMFNVSRRTIVWILHPDRLERNKKQRQERGGWRQYYNKEDWRKTMSEHRRYKQKLYRDGLITQQVT